MGILIYNERFFCSKYHRQRLNNKDIIELDDNIQDALCGAICEPLMTYDKDTHEWFIIDKSKSIYHLLFQAGITMKIFDIQQDILKLKEFTGYDINYP